VRFAFACGDHSLSCVRVVALIGDWVLAGVLRVMEGEMENDDDLIVLLNDYGRFSWEPSSNSSAARPFITTFPAPVNGTNKGSFDFDTEFDWETRHWQFYNSTGDRRYDFVNFRDKQVNLDCARIHNASQIKYIQCVNISDHIAPFLSDAVIDWTYEDHHLFESRSSEEYETCLEQHLALLQDFQKCVQDQLVDYDGIDTWYGRCRAVAPPPWSFRAVDHCLDCLAVCRGVNDRECVGGGGECGPPINGQRPQPRPVLVP
jgi:hypothetical protein